MARLCSVKFLGATAILLFGLGSSGQVFGPEPTGNLSWWKKSIIYQIYPRSFKDSDGDGVGDIRGILSSLDYFSYLGVASVWLSPIYTSPMVDFGYDISDYEDIDPIFGTIQDFDDLIKDAHKNGLNVIMDYVPGHTSTEHEWFKKSERREGKYTNYYMWDDGVLLSNGTRVPPNNWLSVFGGTAWAWNPTRQQFYYHAFVPEQADLNHRDPNVEWEMKNVLRFWLDKGVDGFRVDAIEKLYEVEDTSLDEPVSGLNVTPFQCEYLDHKYTSNQPETIGTVTSWYKVLDEYRQKDGKDRYMVIELYGPPALRNTLYATGGNPFNFDLIDLSPSPTGFEIRDKILNEYANLPKGEWPNFVLGNHDRRRVSHKFGAQYVDVYNMLLLTLWGTPTTYYGEELGMQEGVISWEETVDPWGRNFGPDRYEEFSRDPERTPLQWTSGSQAGFTTGNKTWLPLGQNYATINVQSQRESVNLSPLQLYRQISHLRRRKAFQSGTFQVAAVDSNVFSFVREDGLEAYLVALNVGKVEAKVDLSRYSRGEMAATVVALTPDVQGLAINDTLTLNAVHLKPGDGLVLQFKTGPVVG